MCKGSSAAGGEGLFLQPFHHFVVPLPLHRGGEIRTPLGEACKHASHTCKSNPSRRGLQACFAYLQIPYTREAHLAFSSGRFASARSALAGLAERREGGSRRLTDEVYFCKRNFDYRGVCADFSLSVQTGFIKIKAEVIFSSLFLFYTKFSGSVCANEPDKEGRKIFAIK